MQVPLSSCKKQGGAMGAKDTKAKEYLSDNERFADLCNAVLFDGEQVIKAENLQEKDSTEVLSVGWDRTPDRGSLRNACEGHDL